MDKNTEIQNMNHLLEHHPSAQDIAGIITNIPQTNKFFDEMNATINVPINANIQAIMNLYPGLAKISFNFFIAKY